MKMYSNYYMKQLKELHVRKDRPRGFGGKIKPLGMFDKFMNDWNPSTALDYGCGKGVILNHLKEKYANTSWEGYDPAVLEYNIIMKDKYDLVFSNDVLEHIEQEFLSNVLNHIDTLAQNFVWLRIDTEPARKTLSDGRNAHLSLHPKEWWEIQVQQHIKGKIIYTGYKKGKFDIAIQKDKI